MAQYKKGDIVLLTGPSSSGMKFPEHITLLKLLDVSRRGGLWNDYMLIQINHHHKQIQWPRTHTGMSWSLEGTGCKYTTDIKSIVKFKNDYVKAVFESGYKLND